MHTSTPVVRALPTSGEFLFTSKYGVFSRTILSGLDEIKWSFGPLIVQSRDRAKWSLPSGGDSAEAPTGVVQVRWCSRARRG